MKLRPIAVAFASAVMFASIFAGAGLGMATATATNGSPALAAHRAVGRQQAATDGLAIAAELQAKIGVSGFRRERPLAWA
jgi:hypothetical protein